MAAEKFRLQFLQALSSLIIAAFGLVAALAWNEAIKAAVKIVFGTADDLMGMLVYALLVTILAVIATMLITRAVDRSRARIETEEAKDKKQ